MLNINNIKMITCMGAIIFLIVFMAFSLMSASARGENTGCLTDITWVIAAIIVIVILVLFVSAC